MMPAVKMALLRLEDAASGTFGVLLINGRPFCVTLERPWYGNQQNISCIPAGAYICRRVKSNKFGMTFEVADVQGRAGILFHAGNYAKDSRGCILLGASFENVMAGQRMIANSTATFQKLMLALTDVEAFELTVAQVKAA